MKTYNLPGPKARQILERDATVISPSYPRAYPFVMDYGRGAEVWDMLQAMNTGHEGSLTTIHSNSPRDTLSRIETMVLMAGTELPLKAIREQIASAIDLIVHVERIFDGSRKVTQVCEVQGMESDIILIQDLYKFHQSGSSGRKVVGKHVPVGVRPKFVDKLARRNVSLPPSLFTSESMT